MDIAVINTPGPPIAVVEVARIALDTPTDVPPVNGVAAAPTPMARDSPIATFLFNLDIFLV